MNKKLITLAIGAAIATVPFVTAQATPTLYGQIHVSVESLDDDSGNATDSNISQSSNRSRIGVMGTETLGNGLSAFYQAEWEIGAGSGNNLSERNQYAGIKGNFGAIQIGRDNTPMKDLGSKVDLFWRSQAGENRNLTHGGRWDSRLDNTITYTTPSMNGLQGNLMYITDYTSTTQDNNDTDAYSVSAAYDNGPIFAGLGYEKYNVNAGQDTSALRLVGSYKMNDWKFVGLWQSVSDEGNVASRDRDTWGLGAAYKMGNTIFKGHYYVADDADNVASSGADMISIGVDHNLSANTAIYALYSTTDNDANATFDVVGGGHGDARITATAGTDPSVFGVGLRVKF